MTQEQPFSITIDEFDFSNRLYDCLIEQGIHTIGDLKYKTACDLELSSKSSSVGAKEFATKLGKRGIRLKESNQKLDQVMAVMLGHAIADAMGVPVEFLSRNELAANPVTGYRGYGTHHVPAGTWSDDTSMALATLDSLAHGLDYSDMMQRFCDWKTKAAYTATDEVFDIGITTNDSICRFIAGTAPLACGGADEHDNGNGSLMRIIPAILYCNCLFSDTTIEERIQIIHNVSALTHAHPRSQIACGIYSIVMSKMLDSKDDISVMGKQMFLYKSKAMLLYAIGEAKAFYNNHPEYSSDLAHFSRLFDSGFDKLPEDEIKSSGYVVDTLEAAIWCVLNTESYAECVLKAVNLGKDTDTVAAVAGGLAGALYGLEGIPREWIDGLLRKELIIDLCKNFVEQHNASPCIVFDKARIPVNSAREHRHRARTRNRHIHDFAHRMLGKFKNKDTQENDVSSYDTFAAVCFAFGFTIDLESLGTEYRNTFGKDTPALNDAHVFNRQAFKIHDPDMLGSVIFSKWRYITHWSEESLLSYKNRSWFIAAFERLAEITSDPPIERVPFHNLVDIHGHYVFGVDDGSASIDMSVAMIRQAYEQGIRDIICTSHSWGYYDKYKHHFLELRMRLQEENVDVRLYPGTEIACTYRTMPIIVEQLNDGKLLPLGKSTYALLEFDPNISGDELKLCMKYMNSCKFRPVVAHVERYHNLYEDKHTLDVLRLNNIPLQINAYSLVEEKNEAVRSFARKLLAEKRVAFIGSDAHHMNHRPPNVLSGIEFIYANCDANYADDICYRNAEKLLLF